MSKEVNINLLLDRLYTTGKVDKKYIWALEHYITKLKQENERLKEENKRIFSKVNDDELLISNAMNYAEAQDYKSRCEKAIEYLKIGLSNYEEQEELLNLLQGKEN